MGPQEELNGTNPASGGAAPGQTLPLPLFAAPVCAGVAAVAWTGRRAYLYQDDYVFLTQARSQDFGLDFLRGDLFGHFSPLSRLVDAAAAESLPGNLWMVRGLLLALATVYAVSVVLLAVTVLGRTRLALVAGFSLATSLAVLPLANWWTAGLNILPAVTCSALCLVGVIRLAAGGGVRWGLVALAAYVVALLDYESAILVAGYAFLWVLLFARRVGGAGPWTVLRRSWWVWAAFAVLGASSLVNYRVSYWNPTPRPSAVDTASALVSSLVEVQLPLLLGFSDPGQGTRMRLGTVVAAVALAALLLRLARRRAGARGLLFAFAGWLLPAAALILSRVGLYGTEMVHQPYYYALSTVLVVVGLGMALSAPTRVAPAGSARSARGVPVALSLLAVITCVAWALSAGPAARAVWTDPGDVDRPEGDGPYLERLRESGARLGPDATIIDADVPESLVLAGFAPYNRLHVVAALNGVDVPFGKADLSPYAARASGELVPASLRWSDRLAVRTGAEEGLAVSGTDGPVRSGPAGTCFSTTATTRVEWALAAPVRGDTLVARADVTVDAATALRLVVRADGVWAPGNYDGTTASPDDGGVLDTISATRVDRVGYDSFTPGRTVCLSGLAVGSWSTR